MKSLKKNYLYNLIYQIVAIISPLITAPYISRVLEADNIGKYSYTQSIVSYIILLTTLGTTMYAQREIAFFQYDREKQTRSFVEILLIRVGLGFLGILACGFFVLFYKRYRILFAIQIIEVLANMICVDWLYAGNEDFKSIMTRNLIVRILNIICIFIFVKEPEDLYKYVFIIVFGTCLGNATLWLKIKNYISRISLKDLSFIRHIKGSLSIFTAQVSASIYSMLDKTMIGVIAKSDYENGVYEQAQKIERIALIFVTALGTVIMPRISKAFSGDDSEAVENSIYMSFNYMWLISLPLSFGLIATASSFIPWFYGEGYEKSIILIQILAVLIVPIGISNIIGVQYLMSTKKEKVLTKTVLCGAFVNVVLNLILISKMASIGAAIASVAAEGTIALVQLFYIRNKFNVKNILTLSCKYLVSSIAMFAVVELVKRQVLSKSTIIHSIILVAIGCITYLMMLFVLREKFLMIKIETVIKNKLKR